MGWTGHKIGDGVSLFTRGGLNGVFIRVDKAYIAANSRAGEMDIEIPDDMLLGLAADHIRSERISQLEEASDEDILK